MGEGEREPRKEKSKKKTAKVKGEGKKKSPTKRDETSLGRRSVLAKPVKGSTLAP